ncbi:MAG: WD40 repeat domain-containing serine/threonine protein kinase [Phycisphaerae bacterium]
MSDSHPPSPDHDDSAPTLAGGSPSPSSDLMLTIEAPSSAAPGAAAPPVALPADAYGVGEEIAHGGMGTVLRAEDRKLGRVVAMKVMRLESAASESHRTRFVREATVLARLEHPNIVPIHELGFDAERRLYYTMKLVHGRTLQAVLNGLRRLAPDFVGFYTLDRLLTIFRKVCDAMSLAHARGVVHRDLKPDNIMVGEFGEVLVMDWGLAKIMADAAQTAEEASKSPSVRGADAAVHVRDLAGSQLMHSASLTLDGDVMGTPLYMSPEQAQGRSADIDPQSDVFSLGAILYALLTLHPPVSGGSADDIIGRIRRGEISPPTVYNSPSKSRAAAAGESTDAADPERFQPLPHCPGHKVPAALSAVTMRALAVDKSKRYPTVADLAADVESYQGGFATRAEQAGLWTQLRLLVRRHRREFAVALAAWLVITGLGVWFVVNVRAKERRAVAGEERAVAEADRATRARQAATDAEAVAVREKELTRQALAKSQLDLAEKEFERGKFVEAQKIIDQTPEPFRDANWRFLRAHLIDYTAQLPIASAANVFHLRFLPDGERFLLRGFYRPLGLFTLAGQHVGQWIPEPQRTAGDIGVDAAGTRVAFASSKNRVILWDLSAGTPVRRWHSEIPDVRDVLLSPDGRTVIVTGGDQLIAYSAQTDATLWTQAHKGVAPAFSPDGKTVAILSARSGLTFKIQLVDALTGVVIRTIDATADQPTMTALQFNRAGDRLACLGGDEVILWNPKNGAKLRALHFPGETVHALNPNGDAVATVSACRIRLWDTTTGRLLRSFNGAATPIQCVAFSPDGRLLLSGRPLALEALVNVWPTRLGEEVIAARSPSYDARRILFDPDGARFHTSVKGGVVTWDARTGAQLWIFNRPGTNVDDMTVHPVDGSMVLSEFGKPAFTRLSADRTDLPGFPGNFRTALAFNRGGGLLLAVNDALNASDVRTRNVSLLEYPSGRVLWKMTPDQPGRPFAALCLDDAAVATALGTGGITVWDWKSSTPRRQVDAALTGSIACLAVSPDGLRLATGSPDRWVRTWDAATGRPLSAFRAHWEGVRRLTFSPDGRDILSGGDDGTVRVNDAATGEERLALYGLAMPVADVDYSPDGARVAAITTDGTVKVWDRARSADAALGPRPSAPPVGP